MFKKRCKPLLFLQKLSNFAVHLNGRLNGHVLEWGYYALFLEIMWFDDVQIYD